MGEIDVPNGTRPGPCSLPAPLGSAPVQETVVVLTSDNEVQSFAESIADGNRTLVALGFAEDRVVDLRGR